MAFHGADLAMDDAFESCVQLYSYDSKDTLLPVHSGLLIIPFHVLVFHITLNRRYVT